MKNYIALVLVAFSSTVFAQVGVNTASPQTKFHVDGRSSAATTNPNTGAPSAAQQVDDFVVTSTGNVGTGTTAPSVKLEINNGTTNGAIKIVDGNQGAGRLLVSDANGVGTWKLPNAMKKIRVGTFDKNSDGTGKVVSSDASGGYRYSNVHITLTKGIWMVNMGLTLKSFMKYENGQWVHFRLSAVNTGGISYTGWKNLGTAGNNTSYAGTIFGSAIYNSSNVFQHYDSNSNNYINGSNIIEVTDDTVTLYLMIENAGPETVPAGSPAGLGTKWQFNTENWENYFYANPL